MSTRSADSRQPNARPRSLLGGWFLLILFVQSACTTITPQGSRLVDDRYASASATVYAVDFMEPGTVATHPVPMARAEFQQTLQQLAQDVRLRHRTPRQAAHEVLSLVATKPDDPRVSMTGYWEVEQHSDAAPTWTPLRLEGPVELTPVAEAGLRDKYIQWCAHQGGGDCLGLLDDGPSLRADDRRAFALALAFGKVLDETREALKAELLGVQALVSMIVWTVALYCMMWMVPEPTTKAIAATLTVILMSYLGLKTVYGLMDGWARMADTAHHATTFEELRGAGETFGKVLGADAARVMILAVAALSGHTLRQALSRVRSLPGFHLAGAQFEAQGGAAVMGRLAATDAALASEGALARAVAVTEVVATSPQGPMAVMMFRTSDGSGASPGGRPAETVIRHRGGNRQVTLGDGQRWHLPRGKPAADIPAEDKVGDMLQESVTKVANEWGNHRLSQNERRAIDDAKKTGEYWLARLLEREARGRYVHARLKAQFEGPFQFKHQGVDIVDPSTGRKYEILSGTESNLARHGRRMAGEFFRMLTF